MTDDDLLGAVLGLKDEVQETRIELGGVKVELASSKALINKLKRTVRNVRILAGAMVVLFALFSGTSAYFINENRQTDIQGCKNNNESRQFQYAVWYFVLGHELADTSEYQAPDEITMSETILPIMKKGWRPRDCNNLDRPYPMPEVPKPPKAMS